MRTPPFVATVLFVLAVLAGCSQTPPDTSADDHHHHPVVEATGPAGGEFTVGFGGPVLLAGEIDGTAFEATYAVTAVRVDTEADSENGVLVVADVLVEVFGGEHPVGADNADYLFCLVMDDGTEYHPVTADVGDPLAGVLQRGESIVGTVVFDVPAEAADDGRVRLSATANGGDQIIYWTETGQ